VTLPTSAARDAVRSPLLARRDLSYALPLGSAQRLTEKRCSRQLRAVSARLVP